MKKHHLRSVLSMATKSFLNPEQLVIAQRMRDPQEISNYLGECLLKRLSAHKLWEVSEPIALGSWARGELSPKSDIDLLFAGPESVVRELVSDFEKEGLKLRYRIPADRDDWSKDVEPFDVIALYSAKPFFAHTQVKLPKVNARDLIRAMMKERDERAKRYDSVSQYLEPNLKYGPGGLRDLEQALTVHRFFLKDKADLLVTSTARAEKALNDRKKFLLLVRQKLQLMGGTEILASSMQKEIAEWMGFKDVKEFMAKVQKSLASVSFYADWTLEKHQSSRPRLQKIEKLVVRNMNEAFHLLEMDPSVLVQERIRNELMLDASKSRDFKDKKSWVKVLVKHFNPQMKDVTLRAFFRSKLMSKIVPHLERVTGLVQHDQYHRLTVETHTMQAVREVLRIKKNPKLLGRLHAFVKKLKERDWNILIWAALYHDLGKGLEGDHSTKGADIAKRDLTAFGLSLRVTVEVIWMVQNHLLLSGAAFRQNPQAPTTWKWLFDQGVKGDRIARLAIFTAIDIRATNIEAWNDWKESLLYELTETLLSPKGKKFEGLLEKIAQKKIKLEREFIEPLDPALVEELPNRVLVEDFARLHRLAPERSAKHNLDPLVVKGRKRNEVWVRFHSLEDRAGLFLSYVAQLYALGAGVQEAYVQTYQRFGVYDWFRVKWGKNPAQLSRFLTAVSSSKVDAPRVQFESVDLIRSEGNSAILSFRGRDQKGALVAASQALYEAGLSLKWARVHTWGQQIDDVFSVSAGGGQGGGVDWAKIVAVLREKFLTSHLPKYLVYKNS